VAHFDSLDLFADITARVGGRYQAALDALAAADARDPARAYLAAVCEALIIREK
jgi:hypothetical protein